MDRQSLRPHGTSGAGCDESYRDVVGARRGVDARHDAWHESQVGLVDVVNEDVVTNLQLVPARDALRLGVACDRDTRVRFEPGLVKRARTRKAPTSDLSLIS